MKKVLLFSVIAALGTGLFAGCSKSDSATPAGPYFIKATINGSIFSGTYAATDAGTALRDINGYTTPVAAFSTISIAVANPAAGTYVIDGFSSVASIDSTGTSSVAAAYGSVTVALITDTTVSGTFSFTCTDSTKVTNGSFMARRIN